MTHKTEDPTDTNDQPAAKSLTRFDAFISYASKDLKHVVRLHRFLESYRPKGVKRRLQIYLDRTDIRGGALRPELDEALAASRTLIVCCSEAAADSKWVGTEIESFRCSHPTPSIAIVLLSGDPSVAVPAAARDLEPRYHDLRNGWLLRMLRPSARDELLRLLALLTGSDLRSLINWHRRRFMRQMIAVLTTTALSGSGIWWYVQVSRKVKPSEVTANITYEFFHDWGGEGEGKALANLFLKDTKLSLFGASVVAGVEPTYRGWPWNGKGLLEPTALLRLASDQQSADVRVSGSTAGVWVKSVRFFHDFSGTLGTLENPSEWDGALFEARLEAIHPERLLLPPQDPRHRDELVKEFDDHYDISTTARENHADYSVVAFPILATLELFVAGKPVGMSKGYVAKVMEHDEDSRGLYVVYFPIFRKTAGKTSYVR